MTKNRITSATTRMTGYNWTGNCSGIESDFVREEVISVSDAARNLAGCANRVMGQHITFVLLKNGAPVARIVPAESKKSTARELPAALRRVDLSPAQAGLGKPTCAVLARS